MRTRTTKLGLKSGKSHKDARVIAPGLGFVLGLQVALVFNPPQAVALEIGYAGRISESSGKPVDGPLDFTVKFYNALSSGDAVGPTLKIGNTELRDGVFQLSLNFDNSQFAAVFGDGSKDVYIEVEAGGKVYPRQRLIAVPMALRVPVDSKNFSYVNEGKLTLDAVTLDQVTGLSAALAAKADASTVSSSSVKISNNLSDLTSVSTARTNLGLGSLATASSISNADISNSAAIADSKLAAITTAGKVSGSAITSGTIGGTTEINSSGAITTSGMITGTGNFIVNGTGSTTTELRFNDNDNSNYVSLKAPGTVTTNVSFVLPAADGTGGQLLKTDGSGNLSWITAAGGGNMMTSNNLSDLGSIPTARTNLGLGALATLSAVGSTEITNDSIMNADINTAAAIATSKLSGAVTSITGHGLGSLATLNAVGSSEITNDSIMNADINTAAAIATSKLSGAVTSITGHGLGSLATLSVVGSTEISNDSIMDVDINSAAAIAQSKISGLTTSLSGKEPTITAGTTAQFYRGDKSWTDFNTTARGAVSITAPLTYNSGTGVFGLGQSSGVADGYLSSSDFTAFNAKQAAISAATTVNAGTVTTALQNGVQIKPYGVAAGNSGELRFDELVANGANYVGFKAPDTLAANRIWTLPAADGTNGQILKTDGSGNLDWISAGGSGTVTSVNLTAPAAGITVSGGPVTGAGSITLALGDDLAAVEGISTTGGVERTGANTWSTYTLTAAGKALIDDADATAQRTTLGLGALSTAAAVSGGTAGTITDDTITNADINSAAAIATSKLSGAVTSITGHGLGSLATLSAVSGGTGTTITDDTITDADINSAAAIADTKLATISTAGKVSGSAITSGTIAGSTILNTSGAITTSSSITGLGVNGTTLMAGTGDAGASPAGGTLRAASGAGTDIPGSNLTVTPGNGTGTGGSGSILFQTAPTAGTSATANTMATRMAITSSGNVGIGTTTSPTGRLRVEGAGSSTLGTALGQFSSGASPTAGNLYGIGIDKSGVESLMLGINKNTTTGSVPANSAFISTWFANTGLSLGRGDNSGLPSTADLYISGTGNVGIGTTVPPSLLSAGASSQFQVDSAGDLVKVKNITYSWPGSQGGASTVLTNNGSGTLSWGTATTGTVTSVNLTQPAAGITVSGGPVTSSGSITLALGDDLAAVEGISTTGGVERTASNTWSTYTLTAAGKALIDDADATAQRTTLGLGALATAAAVSGGTAGTITDDTITNADINSAAAIATSKLSGAVTSIASHGLGSLATLSTVSGGTGTTITDDSITDADINSAAAIADTKLATISTAGKVSGSAITSGTIAGSTIFNSSGTITTSSSITGLGVNGTTLMAGTGDAGASPAGGTLRAASGAGSNITGSNLTVTAGNGTGTGGSGSILFKTAPVAGSSSTANTMATRMTILNDGNVGIGTTAPVYNLHVVGSGSSSSAYSLAQFTSGGSPTAGNFYGISIDKNSTESLMLGINKNSTTGSIPANTAYISTYVSTGGMALGRGNNSGLPSTADIYIAGTGNIGIGITNPLFQLSTNDGGTIAGSILRLQNNYLSTDGGYGIQLAGIDNGSTGHDLRVQGRTSPFGAFSDLFTVKNNGNVGIGTTSPSAKIAAAGAIVSMINTDVVPTGTTATLDFSGSNSNRLNLGSATGTVTLTLSNAVAGGVYCVVLIQGATPRTVVWPANVKWQNATLFTLTNAASAMDMVTMIYDGTNFLATGSSNYQ